jgi:hypothetical protein
VKEWLPAKIEAIMEMGEDISIALDRLKKGECVFCGKDHPEKKSDEVRPTGWTRGEISGVGGNLLDKKLAIYPGNISPPTQYRSEGHHCLAFSSFIVDARKAPKDRFAALNHYLKEITYNPNNKNNTIDLPARRVRGDSDRYSNFKEFEESVLANKPLQLHIGGHKKEFLDESNILLNDIINSARDQELCRKAENSFKSGLKQKVIKAEDRAFKKTASAESPWIAHPGPLREAELYVKNKHNISSIEYPKL